MEGFISEDNLNGTELAEQSVRMTHQLGSQASFLIAADIETLERTLATQWKADESNNLDGSTAMLRRLKCKLLEMLPDLLWIKRSLIIENKVIEWMSATPTRAKWLIDGMDKKKGPWACTETSKRQTKISFFKPITWQAGINYLIQLLELAIALVQNKDCMEYHWAQRSWNHLDCLVIQALKVSALVDGEPCSYKASGLQEAMEMFQPQVLAEAIVLDFLKEVLNPRGVLVLDGKPAPEKTPGLCEPELKELLEVAAHQGQDMIPKLPAGNRLEKWGSVSESFTWQLLSVDDPNQVVFGFKNKRPPTSQWTPHVGE
ncbi:uncharacterized protein MELLADRAFT_102616 [Melampsora larici-populina 98AG31]|uniref:Uncharacterized protein n=1 Tax=Melampsora larici-populina (strain 98AG31 / pathotype 3-4-7) TaxID=747676 RepID=F4R8U5_MELLP|nr:uncharacterized protein MELLADRAFT_102616 [Melampsora larici-populina 98AG31]EGG11267.1 hypothetical protein MELLADRAFT_102616 [Melampsora larici-populina 98AG31]